MTTVTLAGFLSKKQIEAAYGRSFRSLTRDITRALKVGDTDVLQHLKLVTEDETIREGRDVTPEMIQELSTNGRRPMWLAEEVWVADWVTQQRSGRRRDNAEVQSDTRPESQSPTIDLPVASTPNQSAPVEFLQQRIEDQKQQIDILRGQLRIKDDQIRTANQLAEQSQQLMKNMQVLMKNVQDRLLGEGSLLIATPLANSPEQPSQPAMQRAATAAADRKRRRSAKPGPHKKNARRSNAAKPDAGQPDAGRLQRWFPTVFGRNRRGN